MAKLWLKNGKIVTDSSGRPILCDTCPCDCCKALPDTISAAVSTGTCPTPTASAVNLSRSLTDPCQWVGLSGHPPIGQSDCANNCKGLAIILTVDCSAQTFYLQFDNHCCVAADKSGIPLANLYAAHTLDIIATADCDAACIDCTGPITVTIS
jgi:hypothetical protein